MLGTSDLRQFRELLNDQEILVDLPDRALRARLATLLLRYGLSTVEQLEILLNDDWATWREVMTEMRRPCPSMQPLAEGKPHRR